jgi:hypothetical protein
MHLFARCQITPFYSLRAHLDMGCVQNARLTVSVTGEIALPQTSPTIVDLSKSPDPALHPSPLLLS